MTKTSLKKLTSVVLAVLMLFSVFAVSASAADSSANPTGGYTVVLDASGVDTGFVEWKAWTWADGKGGHWVSAHGTSSADITYDNVDKNIIFAYFQDGTGTPDAVWTGKIGQTGDMTVQGATFKVTSAGGGSVTGTWSGTPVEVGDNPSDNTDDTGSVTPTTPSGDGYTVVLDASGVETGFVEWKAWTWADGQDGHWVSAHGTSASDITYDTVDKNIIFAYFQDGTGTPDAVWTGKIGQTGDMTVDGATFTVTSAGGGSVDGYWSGDPVYHGDNTDPSSYTDPTSPSSDTNPTSPSSQQTLPTASTAPIVTEPSSIVSPTDPTAADEDTSFYVSAKSNINTAGSKVKVTGNDVKVSYTLTTPEKIDDGQVSISYDTTKLSISPVYNTAASMFPVVTDAQYNLNANTGVIVFNFSGINGKYDFTNGGVLVNLVFTKKSESTVGTATVYMNVSELASKTKTYIDDNKIAADAGLTVGQAVESTTPTIPSETNASTASENNVTVSAGSNLTAAAQTVQVTKSNVKVTFNLTAAELISYGDATVTFDNTKLALESRFNTRETMFSTLSSNVSYRLNVSDGVMKFNFTGVSNDHKGIYDFRSGGEVITLMFTVRAGASDTANVNLTFDELGSIDTKYIENSKVLDSSATVAVTAAGETATQSDTDPTSETIATGDGTTETNPTPPSSDTNPSSSDSNPTDSSDTNPSSSDSNPTDSSDTNPSSSETNPTGPSDTNPSSGDTKPSSGDTNPTGSSATTPTSAPKTTFKFTSAKTKIYVGATTLVKVTNLKNGKGTTKFATSNKKVATVTSMGIVKGVKKGSVIISAKNNGVTMKVKITVVQRNNPMTVKAKTITVKPKAKKTVFKKTKAFTIKKAKGTVTFKKTKGSKYVSINKNSGKITVKKGLKKGKTYKVKFKVTAKGTKTYKAKSKTVTVKVKVSKK